MVIHGSVDKYNMLHLETSTLNGDCMQNFTGFVINEFSSHGHNFCRQSYWYQKEWETTRQREIGTLFENMNRSTLGGLPLIRLLFSHALPAGTRLNSSHDDPSIPAISSVSFVHTSLEPSGSSQRGVSSASCSSRTSDPRARDR